MLYANLRLGGMAAVLETRAGKGAPPHPHFASAASSSRSANCLPAHKSHPQRVCLVRECLQERLNRSSEEISKVRTHLYGEVTRFATNVSVVGDRLKSTVKAYNDALPGLDRFTVSKSGRLKQLGSAKGRDPELPEPIELEPGAISSSEPKRLGTSRPVKGSSSRSDSR